MASRAPAGRLTVTFLTLAPWLLLGCHQGGYRADTAGVSAWAEGPARWLMLPDEAREVRRLASNREAIAFMERFWRRRDPDPETPGNPCMQTFHQRVEAADGLYGDGGIRGSLTDRGRALILLGPPPVLRYNQKSVPVRDPAHMAGKLRAETRRMVLESWSYPVSELPPELVALLPEGGRDTEIELVFAVEERRTYLIEGERYLELAARAAVRTE